MEMSRRAALCAALAAPTAAFAKTPQFGGWPHPEVGVPWDGKPPKEWRGHVLTGQVEIGGKVIHQGRLYTAEEYARVRDDVAPYVARVMEATRTPMRASAISISEAPGDAYTRAYPFV